MNNTLFGQNQLQGHSIKNLIQWGDHLSVDHPEIDAQHKALFDLGMSVYDNWQGGGSIDALRPTVASLDHLLKAHCAYEEKLLAEIGYYNLAEHAAEHHSLLKEMNAVTNELNRLDTYSKFTKGSLLAPGWPITQLILGFIVGHVSTSDMSYCRSINESRKGAE